VYTQGELNFDAMTDLPQSLKSILKQNLVFGSFSIVEEQISKDGTIKRAIKLKDGQIIESVLMPYKDGRRTACISSQAGCAMGCVFCATGQMGFSRQLTSTEIFEQVAMFSCLLRRKGESLTNIVFMGMVWSEKLLFSSI
jgi:23S rRNA (adenine2503-C2)-methyltransferase